MMHNPPLLLQCLRQQLDCATLDLAQWDLLIRQARSAQLLGWLACRVDAQVGLAQVPYAPRRHLQSAHIVSAKQQRDLHWEIGRLQQAFKQAPCALVLLKGAAYAIGQLPPAAGRWFTDIDILVPFNDLAEVEKQLMLHGWLGEAKSAYDQAYYRNWMHEIEPLTHVLRGSVIDVHHNILPRTVRECPDARLLLADTQELTNSNGIRVLSPVDRVIHSAVHLFYEGELEHGLRDLVDLRALLDELDATAKLTLVERALQLGLQQAVYYALRYSQRLLDAGNLEPALNELEQSGRLRLRQIRLMDFLFLRALQPDHASCDDFFTALARWLLYVRSHYLRMPLYLLIPHLARKAWIRWREQA